jgi:hypothetical protein
MFKIKQKAERFKFKLAMNAFFLVVFLRVLGYYLKDKIGRK